MDALVAIQEKGGSLSRNDPCIRPLYSISKTFIAASVMSLGIDLELPASNWLGREWLPDGDKIRIRHLLTHSAGLRDYGVLPEYAEAIESGEPVWSDETFAVHTLLKPRHFEPGEGFAYSNPGYWVLKRILELETRSSLAEVVRSQILAPLSLTETSVAEGQFAPDLPDYPAGWVWHGLLVGSAADCVRFMTSEFVEPLKALTVRVPGRRTNWQHPHYGLGVMIEPGKRYGHNGGGPGYTAACYCFEDSGRTICVLMQKGPEDGAMIEALKLNSASA